MFTNDDCKHCNGHTSDKTEMLCICNIGPSLCEECVDAVIRNGGCDICSYYLNHSMIAKSEDNENVLSKLKSDKLKTTHLTIAANWFNEICKSEKWNLNEAEKLKILGNISSTNYDHLLAGNLSGISSYEINDVTERLSILITIFEYTYALIGTNYAYSLFSKPNSNPILSGKSIKEMLLANNSIEQFYIVRKYLIDTAHY
ncbi:MAG: hypothetical protein EOO53_01905 [Gammaproteobacteria bacterium]|nr:MAG: hypothetical protein EOO53_01905 [Gammaproteobacteria bacterium]